jgi:ATP synthase F1 gamma subunit
MPSLKELRSRISSVKSTQRITSAMKMVAAAKLRRAQEMAVAARPYAERMERMLGALAAASSGNGAPLLAGNGKEDTHLLVLVSSDRGLCGRPDREGLLRGPQRRRAGAPRISGPRRRGSRGRVQTGADL